MNLVIDLGNTFAKTALFQGDKILEVFKIPRMDFSRKIEKILSNYPEIKKAVVCSVLRDTEPIKKKLKNYPILDVSENPKLPFCNKYSTPESLGNDRIALAAAAAHQYPNQNCLVIDAGTCITYDLLNQNKEYLGGGISPGLRLRFDSVHKFTEKLPLITVDNNHLKLVGTSTEESLRSGIQLGFVAEIDGMISNYKSEFKDLTVILTGGDNQFLSKRLKNSIFANSNFLLEGLNHILEYNKFQ
ncbi:type III pantothenate kinase [Zunongwangia sp.]|uniref:type III pantothenate kinase n=1 Tax=Zunongwangia sp. TaxID=1965325 RepID=UPI003AA9AF30